ncbi:hypothetical protein ACIBAH_35005 [Streptomyces sp. NPDC051445]|uniref:hypothetical protein n=1 Tax=Streptomyces sp. NPDC051445 TaxID=3365653 RepID=UPI0037A0C9C1
MAALPESDLELQKLLSAGMNGVEIASIYGVDETAVYHRLRTMNIHLKGPNSPVASVLPWDIANHPDKRRLTNQAPFRGLRYYLQAQMGEKLSERAQLDLRAFLNRVRDGHVLALLDGQGFTYVPRTPEDRNLVVRWPKSAKGGDQSRFIDAKSPDESRSDHEEGQAESNGAPAA